MKISWKIGIDQLQFHFTFLNAAIQKLLVVNTATLFCNNNKKLSVASNVTNTKCLLWMHITMPVPMLILAPSKKCITVF